LRPSAASFDLSCSAPGGGMRETRSRLEYMRVEQLGGCNSTGVTATHPHPKCYMRSSSSSSSSSSR
jgi:hypothetical protein